MNKIGDTKCVKNSSRKHVHIDMYRKLCRRGLSWILKLGKKEKENCATKQTVY